MDKEGEFFSAVLVNNGTILETLKNTPEFKDIEKIDLENSFVYPGFIDTHTHSFEGGLYSSGVNLENVTSLEEVFELLVEAKPIDGKILAFHFDENDIKEQRFPTAEELDKIYPEMPVLLRRVDGHSSVINTSAAKKINWEKPLLANFNGYLNKSMDGKASKWFHENLSDEAILRAYTKASEIALQTGHTTIHTMVGNTRSDTKHFKLIQKNINNFPIEFILYPQITDIESALEIGSPRIGGCLLADGSFGSHTAALLQPYSDQPDNKGILYRSNEFWEKFIRKAHRENLQVFIHCIGDAAITQILNCYEKVQKKNSKDMRHGIIHNELTSDNMLDRMQKINISSIMQPAFDRLWGGNNGLYEKRLGKERTSRTNRLASIYNRGILITGGSDWYITDLNALKGIDAAVRIHNPYERLSKFQALELYTSNAAQLSSDENRLGRIKKELQADFVCLDEDIFKSENINKIKINSVIKKGISYQW